MIQICGVSRYCGRLVIEGTDPSKVTSHLLEPILLLSSASFLRSNLIPQPEQHADTPQYKTWPCPPSRSKELSDLTQVVLSAIKSLLRL